jgi:uncharacterized protein
MQASTQVIPRRLAVTTDDGLRLAALLYEPATAADGAVLVCHGAGSSKENHGDFALRAVARGLAALTFDFRGHGASEGAGDGGEELDLIACAAALRSASASKRLVVRGSSMGAYLALAAAARRPGLFGRIAALCPADEASMLAGFDRLEKMLAAGDPDALAYGTWDLPAVRAYYRGNDLALSTVGLQGVLIVHARDDGTVPYGSSQRLFAALAEPKRLIGLAAGGHTGIQHDASLQETTLDWLTAGCAETTRTAP